MNKRLELLLENRVLAPDKIYSSIKETDISQSIEIKLREEVASKHYDDYLAAISKSHSISVMDYEVVGARAVCLKSCCISRSDESA